MRSNDPEEIVEKFDELHDVVSWLIDQSFDALTTPECLAMLERLERETRRLPVPGHALINQLSRQASETELGGKLGHSLANRLRITRGEAGRRIREAEDLGTPPINHRRTVAAAARSHRRRPARRRNRCRACG